MTRTTLLWAALCAAPFSVPAIAQGVVNPTLLAPPADGPQTSGMAPVVAATERSVVHVFVEVDGPRGVFPITRPSTGVVVSGEGHIVTWGELVAEAIGADDKRLKVQVQGGGEPMLAEVLEIDEATGAALIQAQVRAGAFLAPAAIAARPPRPGERIVQVSLHDGEDRVAYGGVLSPAMAGVRCQGKVLEAGDIAVTDAKAQRRCHGAGLFGVAGEWFGLLSTEHVLEWTAEPELADLKRPTYSFVLTAARIREAFADRFAAFGQIPPPLPEARSPWPDAVEKVAAAVVGVGADEAPVALGLDDPAGRQRRRGFGSGVVIDGRGLVVTNDHILGGAKRAWVRREGRTYAAEVLDRNEGLNLALLAVRLDDGETWPAARLRSAKTARDGFALIGVGNPTGEALAVTAGVLSARRGPGPMLVQADPSLGNHTAGGAVIDAAGAVIGIADGGRVDPIELAFAQRGDEAVLDSDLHLFPSSETVCSLFRQVLASYAEDNPALARPPAPSAAELAALHDGFDPVGATDGALLNVYIRRARRAAAVDDNPFAAHAEVETQVLGLGSGVIVDGSGLALSNWHVVDEATEPDGSMVADHEVRARTRDGREYSVEVLSISREDDLALLRLELDPGQRVPFVELGSSEAMAIGERVVAIGNPLGNANTVTSGILSAIDQETNVKGRWAKFENMLEPDAAINGGNSGGALLDAAGRLVGINSAGGRGFGKSGYAIPVDHVRRQVLGLLMSPAKLRSPWIGLTPSHELGEGVGVAEVDPHGPAAAAGIVAGDRLMRVNETELTWSVGWVMQLRAAESGRSLTLRVRGADGEVRSVEVSPWSAPTWGVWRQARFCASRLWMADAPAQVQAAALALQRAVTGDPEARPAQWPESVVRVDRLHPEFDSDTDLRPGDLVLATERRVEDRGGAAELLEPVAAPETLQRRFDDPAQGSYEGADFVLWIYRGGEVRKVSVTAMRQFY